MTRAAIVAVLVLAILWPAIAAGLRRRKRPALPALLQQPDNVIRLPPNRRHRTGT